MKEINLLPPNIAFNYKKFVISRLALFFVILNVLILLYISMANIFTNNRLKNILNQRKNYYNKVEMINAGFNKYKNQYVKLTKELTNLQKEIEYYKNAVILHRSAYADSIVFANTFFDDVWFSSVLYKHGSFEIDGYAPSKSKFQEFFGRLEKNKYIKDARFFYIKQEDGKYIFKINYRIAFR